MCIRNVCRRQARRRTTGFSLALGFAAAACSGVPPEEHEDRGSLEQTFKNQLPPNFAAFHELITTQALAFLKRDVRNILAVKNAAFDARWLKFAPAHFDNCTFTDGSLEVQRYTAEAVKNAGEFPPPFSCPTIDIRGCAVLQSGDAAISNFARALHPVQDFYAHSNWVEVFGGDKLLDETLGEFRPLYGGLVHPLGAVFADDSLVSRQSLWTIRPALGNRYPTDVLTRACPRGQPDSACIPAIVTGRTDEPRWVFGVSPVVTHPNRCPPNIRIFHDRDLAKDEPNGRMFWEAWTLAVRQTTHEWCRFQNLVYEQGLARGTAAKDVGFLCEKWVEDRAAANAECSAIQGFPQGALCAPRSCRDISSGSPSGNYVIDPNGGDADDAFEVYCDLTQDGGGWTLIGRGEWWVKEEDLLPTGTSGSLSQAKRDALVQNSSGLFRVGDSARRLFIQDANAIFGVGPIVPNAPSFHYWRTTGTTVSCSTAYADVINDSMVVTTTRAISCDPTGVGSHTCGYDNGWMLLHSNDTFNSSGGHPCAFGVGGSPANQTLTTLWVR
jgi:hypothetical protein